MRDIHIPPREYWRRHERGARPCGLRPVRWSGPRARRHGVQLVCVVFPGRSGGPGGFIGPPRPLDRDDRRTNEGGEEVAIAGRSLAVASLPTECLEWSRPRRAHYLAVYGRPRPAQTLVRTAVSARFMVRMGSPVRFRRGAPHQTSSSSGVRARPVVGPKGRQLSFARDLPDRFVRCESVRATCRSHSEPS